MGRAVPEQTNRTQADAVAEAWADVFQHLSPDVLRKLAAALNALLDDKADQENLETALLSEPSLARDWARPEEEEAWRDL